MTLSPQSPVRRSCLSVPGSDLRKVAKAAASAADEIVLDLEDAVAPDGKDAARDQVAAWLQAPGTAQTGPSVAVRINAPRTPWCHADILACAAPGGPLRSLVVPKVESAGDLEFVDRLLDGAEAASGRTEPLAIQALIETATGLANLREITSACARLDGLILGYADLSASLGRSPQAPPEAWFAAQDAVLVAARAAGTFAIDGPYLGVAADEDYAQVVRHAALLGFDGKWVIHPRQIDTANAAFTPSAEEVTHAREVLTALERSHRAGAGAVAVDGQMLDEAVAVRARRVLSRAGTTAARQGA